MSTKKPAPSTRKKGATKAPVPGARRKVKVTDVTLESLGILTMVYEGTSPLIVKRFGSKPMKAMLDGQTGAPKKKPGPRQPEQEMLDCLHVIGDTPKTLDDLEKTTFGFPAVAFKAAMIRAAQASGVAMTQARGMFYILTDDGELVEIKAGSPPEMDTRTARNRGARGSVADLRFRPIFHEWGGEIRLEYNARAVSAKQLINWFSWAGKFNGIAELRCGGRESSNTFGAWRVVSAEYEEPDLDKLEDFAFPCAPKASPKTKGKAA